MRPLLKLMRRGGHASPLAALRYQHATDERDRVIADALGRLAQAAEATDSRSMHDTTDTTTEHEERPPESGL